MLAYVFWHAPAGDIEPAAYDTLLIRFHAALAANPSPGFVRSFSTRTSRLPWLDVDAGYEDWYLMADSAALDPLDAAAVDAGRRGVHDEAARAARRGIGGLYRLLRGEPVVPAQTHWFGKPEGTTYAEFQPVLDAIRYTGSTLWQRQMVLGPAPEFAAQAPTRSDDVTTGRILHFELQPIGP